MITLIEMRSRLRVRALLQELRELPGELEWVEFKRSIQEPKLIGELISALSNSARLHDQEFGYLIWGVDDVSHEVVGTSFEPDGTIKSQPYKFWLQQRLLPAPALEFHTLDVEGKRVVMLRIPAATELPVAFDRVPRIRLGSATPPLRDFPEVEKKLVAKLRPFLWEQGIAAEFLTSNEVLELLDLDAFLRLRGLPLSASVASTLERLKESSMIESDTKDHWNILNVGAILLARDLSMFPTIERKALRIIQYTGSSRLKAKPEQNWSQGYAVGLEASLKFLEGILPAQEVIGATRTEDRVYPSEAVKELLANALIHQDMTVTGAGPKVEVFDDRIEFSNPGKPVTDWRKLFGAEPRSRNERLALEMRKMDLCEERGSGLRRTIEAVNAVQLLPAEFRSTEDSARVVLHGHRRDFDAMDQATKVRAIYYYSMLLSEKGQRLTNTALRDRFPMQGNATVKASAALKQAVVAHWIKLADPDHPNSGYLPFWA